MDTEGAGGYEAEVPGFAGGGRVERTGIALVHEGEYLVPAPGSAAEFSSTAGETVVNYYFPVEIEVVGTVGDDVVEHVARQVFDQLDRELSSRL